MENWLVKGIIGYPNDFHMTILLQSIFETIIYCPPIDQTNRIPVKGDPKVIELIIPRMISRYTVHKPLFGQFSTPFSALFGAGISVQKPLVKGRNPYP